MGDMADETFTMEDVDLATQIVLKRLNDRFCPEATAQFSARTLYIMLPALDIPDGGERFQKAVATTVCYELGILYATIDVPYAEDIDD